MKYNKKPIRYDRIKVCYTGRRVFRSKPVIYGCDSSLYVITIPSLFRRARGFVNPKRRLKREWKLIYRDHLCKWRGEDEV